MNKHEKMEKSTELLFDFSKIRKIGQNIEPEHDVVPVVVQNIETKDVLIIAYANELALQKTIELRKATFWSTSRNELWTKGLTSGNALEVKEIRVNCDQNSLLYLVLPVKGGACHVKNNQDEAYQSCYYRKIDLDHPERLEFVE